MSKSKDFQQFMDVLQHFDHVMLVTDRGGRLRSRPMVIGDVTDDGRIRFITSDDSAKLDELTEHAQVNVSAQGEQRFLSISGNARLSKDDDLVEAAWQRHQSVWFAEGRDDPHVIAIEVIPEYGEYWDRSEGNLITRVFGASEAHGEVDFRGKPV
ncbi:MAG: pyridoxamine 5'-phosphate oxidase family protein [Woeseiaceae bacterium]